MDVSREPIPQPANTGRRLLLGRLTELVPSLPSVSTTEPSSANITVSRAFIGVAVAGVALLLSGADRALALNITGDVSVDGRHGPRNAPGSKPSEENNKRGKNKRHYSDNDNRSTDLVTNHVAPPYNPRTAPQEGTPASQRGATPSEKPSAQVIVPYIDKDGKPGTAKDMGHVPGGATIVPVDNTSPTRPGSVECGPNVPTTVTCHHDPNNPTSGAPDHGNKNGHSSDKLIIFPTLPGQIHPDTIEINAGTGQIR